MISAATICQTPVISMSIGMESLVVEVQRRMFRTVLFSHCYQRLRSVIALQCSKGTHCRFVVPGSAVCAVQLMTNLCEGIMASLLEFLGNTIGVMSPAALASLFLEMNFIEGIIPDVLKTDTFDNRINDCYEVLLAQLLRLIKTKMPSPKTEFGKVGCHARLCIRLV